MTRCFLLLFLVLAGCATATASRDDVGCVNFGANEALPLLVRVEVPGPASLLCNQGYAVLASGVSHGPLWVAEHLWSDDVEAAERLKLRWRFYQDYRVSWAAALADYHGSIYDRGHMAPSGDQPDPTARAETYVTTNIIPQTAALNENKWAHIEQRVRDLTEEEGELYVVTGPDFGRAPVDLLGPDRVYVPARTWKAVYSPGSNRAGAYVCDNVQQRPHCMQESVQDLTQQTGVDPFPQVAASVKARAWLLP
ncbi:MAG: DNA/RNA non-specific endonuclease [Acetobacter orientalis]|uniref:DNA/RNA non-specific endonuclease n=2 Tax=Acetobacter orientalis TaxID=146474 RepID=UPI0039E9058B